MKQIMVRNAHSDFYAMMIAKAMESAGGSVFSITYNGQHTGYGASLPHSEFIVWAKVKDDEHIGLIDQAIEKALDRRPL